MFVHEIKWVDLKRSKWDKEKSDPKKGKYVFEPGGKAYISYADKTKWPASSPIYFLSWSRYDPQNNFRDLLRDKYSKGYTEVNVNEDDWIWPEPLVPNESGWYIIPGGDLIVMKRPLVDELKDRLAAKAQSDMAAAATLQSFETAIARDGGKAIPQEQIADLLEEEQSFRR